VGNDVCKALRTWAYYEATETNSLSLSGWQRECKINDCNGRCHSELTFGQGFDSPQLHLLRQGKVNTREGKRVYKSLLPFFEKMLKNIDI